jgi:hypothetical protein
MLKDGVHPDWRANAFIADKLIASLREKGIMPAI